MANWLKPMIVLKSEQDLALMRPACVLAQTVLDEVCEHIQPGMTTKQIDAFAGERIRSYSMNCMVGDPGDLLDQFNPTYVQYFTIGSISDPSKIFVFLDEHPDTLNDGFFMNRLGVYEWGNRPGSFHNDSGNFSFADGHVETHKWLDRRTIQAFSPDYHRHNDPVPGNQDIAWLRLRTTVRK